MLMTKIDIRTYLESEQARIQAKIGTLSHSDSYPTLAEEGQNRAVQTNLEILLEQIKKALTRLQKGAYGLCEVCEDPIDSARLQALPYATTCVTCKSAQEGNRHGKGLANRGSHAFC